MSSTLLNALKAYVDGKIAILAETTDKISKTVNKAFLEISKNKASVKEITLQMRDMVSSSGLANGDYNVCSSNYIETYGYIRAGCTNIVTSRSFAAGENNQIHRYAYNSSAVGSGSCVYSSDSSAFGRGLNSYARGEVVIGRYNDSPEPPEYNHTESYKVGDVVRYVGSSTGSHTNEALYTCRRDCRGQTPTSTSWVLGGSFGNRLLSVGNGMSNKERSNAFTLDDRGNGWFSGTVECNAVILTSPNGTKYQLSVNDDGTLATECLV